MKKVFVVSIIGAKNNFQVMGGNFKVTNANSEEESEGLASKQYLKANPQYSIYTVGTVEIFLSDFE